MCGVTPYKRRICCSDYNNTSLRLKVSLFLKWERYLPSCCKIWLPHLYKPILIPITYKLVNYISNYSTKQYHESLLWALKELKNANKILPIAFLVTRKQCTLREQTSATAANSSYIAVCGPAEYAVRWEDFAKCSKI